MLFWNIGTVRNVKNKAVSYYCLHPACRELLRLTTYTHFGTFPSAHSRDNLMCVWEITRSHTETCVTHHGVNFLVPNKILSYYNTQQNVPSIEQSYEPTLLSPRNTPHIKHWHPLSSRIKRTFTTGYVIIHSILMIPYTPVKVNIKSHEYC